MNLNTNLSIVSIVLRAATERKMWPLVAGGKNIRSAHVNLRRHGVTESMISRGKATDTPKNRRAVWSCCAFFVCFLGVE